MPETPHASEGQIWPPALLQQYDARTITVARGGVVFSQGDPATALFIVREGQVKMVSVNEHGREFMQGVFGPGQTFGEPPFFAHQAYPASAVAVSDAEVWRLDRDNAERLLREHPGVHLALTRVLSTRLLYKSMMLSEIAVEEARHRVEALLDFWNEERTGGADRFLVPFTRQQMADMTGLRIETVVRVLRVLEADGRLTRDGRAVVWHPRARPA
ncbi:MAG: Crp/Fnr family transcriptional regulator [Vicinamibacteraceae bacterium]|nr:Crp/Fnr family transcriptional regulator [Vicinamibacteraceae bacterium]